MEILKLSTSTSVVLKYSNLANVPLLIVNKVFIEVDALTVHKVTARNDIFCKMSPTHADE